MKFLRDWTPRHAASLRISSVLLMGLQKYRRLIDRILMGRPFIKRSK